MMNRLVRVLPRPWLVMAAEISGLCSIQNPSKPRIAATAARCRSLLTKRPATHPLFDCEYYLQTNPDVSRSVWPPLLHFLLWGGFEGRKPHPVFDPAWYMAQYPDVAVSGLNPLQHYVRFGSRESRSPHPLFDTAWYLRAYPDAKAAGCDALAHFLSRDASEGRQPHPLFDAKWYARSYAQVNQSGLNPLVHYELHGGKQGLNPNRNFDTKRYIECYPSVLSSGLSPLAHYVSGIERGAYNPHPGYPRPIRRHSATPPLLREQGLSLGLSRALAGAAAPAWKNFLTGPEVPVFVVYGQSNVAFIEAQLIPALAEQRCRMPVHLHTLNYRGPQCLLSSATLDFSRGALTGVTDWSPGRENRHIGFGESVNYLFTQVAPESCFFIINPDAAPMPGCLDRLLDAFCRRNAAIVEPRQWPSEHPKEYDPATGYTPWASGAFSLFSSAAFAQLKGFDPIYFLYNEDVDLSWRAWLQGMPVIYEPAAMCAHYTGALSYQHSRYYLEHFFSLRNALVIAYKFFGDAGELAAWRWIEDARLPAALHASIESSYKDLRGRIQRVTGAENAPYAGQVKIVGLNLYHRLRQA